MEARIAFLICDPVQRNDSDMKALYSDGSIRECADELKTIRHTASHIMAQAVKRLFPDTKIAIGPAIDDGFYYDFDKEGGFKPEDLESIEIEMKNIVKENLKLETYTLPRAEAIKYMVDKGEIYKAELIEDLPENAAISFYKQGDFTDLCAGPHALYTKAVKAFKLISIAGAYWRGNEDNKMLTRIYGTAFQDKEKLDEHLKILEEIKKRDHRKLGKDLGIFMLLDEAPGFPFFLPKGMVLKNILMSYWREVHQKDGYEEISTPLIMKKCLWEQSGHWDHYKDNMYTTIIDDEDFCIKPMNCPGAVLVYKNEPRSYKNLPLKLAEIGTVHRHERSGTLHGLMRVRCFTQDDAHIFMTSKDVQNEIKNVVKLIDKVYQLFGFKYHVELSTRPENSMGSDEDWIAATVGLENALRDMNLKYIVNEGDGAFYGPKIDFHLEDSLGRTWQCGTVQLDFQMPQRFEVSYIGADGNKHTPIMIHRVAFGSIERFIGILIEHYGGKFPTWLAPVQVKVLPVSEKSLEYSSIIVKKLKSFGIRCELDDRDEKISYKIREAQLEKVPYMLILGEKESKTMNVVSVRSRDNGNIGIVNIEEFIHNLLEEIGTKKQA